MAAARNKGGLGKGLGALINSDIDLSENHMSVQNLAIDSVYPNIEQPRKKFDDERLKELAESIKKSGVIIPIIVTKTDKGYLIVAGERRWRASKLAKLKEIPAIVRELSDIEILQQALIENIQRQDLNPLEEGEALKKLIDDYDMKQEEVSELVGRSRPAITNMLRLLNLSDKVKDLLLHEEISAGHARALLPISDPEKQLQTAEQVINEQLSVRQTEKLVRIILNPPKKKEEIESEVSQEYLLSVKNVEDRLIKALGTKVTLKDKNNKGQIIIEYFSNEDLDRILEIIE
ncbi:MAG TPA: ParB/RepB/Spo0J family partition protein [Clostridiaceae bacterium]|nr:ParB/RepB/Spo0J family partition protein [Clostridiaceae bacterium]